MFDGGQAIAGPVRATTARPARSTGLQAAYERADGEAVEVRYSLGAQSALVRLGVYDLRGRCVRVLLDEARAAGEYVQIWNRRDRSGARVARGVYFVRLLAGSERASRKVLLVRD